MNVEHDRSRDASDREIASSLVVACSASFHRRALEENLRVVCHIKEIRALQVGIAGGLARPQLIRIDHHIDRAMARIVRLEFHCAFDVLEVPPHPRHHHVLRAELRSTVSKFKSPRCHQLILNRPARAPESDQQTKDLLRFFRDRHETVRGDFRPGDRVAEVSSRAIYPASATQLCARVRYSYRRATSRSSVGAAQIRSRVTQEARGGLERGLFGFGLLQQGNREQDPGGDEREAANRSNGSEPADSSDRQ